MNTLEKHKQFHKTFGQPILDHPDDMSTERNKLRLKLAFEELSELAEAFGLSGTFTDICEQYAEKILVDTNKINVVEVLDALVDIEVINNGTILETGLSNIYYDAYNQTHDNNMSKAHKTLCDAEKTIEKQKEKGEKDMTIKQVDNLFVVYRSDGKILKPYNYVSNDLANVLDSDYKMWKDIEDSSKNYWRMECGKFYERNEDMSVNGKISLLKEDDGDIIITVTRPEDNFSVNIGSVQFCTRQGGGRSQLVREKLVELAEAIEIENNQNPIRR